jgi:hypothetical protein
LRPYRAIGPQVSLLLRVAGQDLQPRRALSLLGRVSCLCVLRPPFLLGLLQRSQSRLHLRHILR